MNKKRLVIAALIAALILAGLIICLMIYNSVHNSVLTISEEEAEAVLLASCQEELERIKQELNVSEITVSGGWLSSYNYKKPSASSRGEISADCVFFHLTSSEFWELEEEIYNEEMFEKYSNIRFINKPQFDNHSFEVSDEEYFFINSKGEQFHFREDFDSHSIYKGLERVYASYSDNGVDFEEYVYESSNAATPKYEKCAMCGGKGVAKFYYGGSAMEAWMDGYNDYEYKKCPNCDGTGKRKIK